MKQLNENLPDIITTRILGYTVVVEPVEEGGFLAYVPSLGGIVTQGETLAEVHVMAVDLIRGYIECLEDEGLKIPRECIQPKVERKL